MRLVISMLAHSAPAPIMPMQRARINMVSPGALETFEFNGHATKYVAHIGSQDDAPPIVFVHGFGASSLQWRATLADVAATGRTAYAIDLLGFGSSPKPAADYSIELWASQVRGFVSEVVLAESKQTSAVLVGNSIGSLTCVQAAATDVSSSIAGVGLFNCAIGMNSKAPPLPTDPIAYAVFFSLIGTPLFVLIDLLLASPLGRALFDKVRTDETVRNVLESGVYRNPVRVDDELVQSITRPATDPGAFEAFVAILSGDAGPRPEQLVPQIREQMPIAVWWGPEDQVTPLIGVVGQFFKALPTTRPLTDFVLLPDTGHCPFDDRPELASPALLEWLDRQWPTAGV